VDPQNPLREQDERTGIVHSVLRLPAIARTPATDDGPPGSLSFSYNAQSGETVTVAGDFNGWDPFMYELTETAWGRYTLVLPLPPGTYHYVFYHRGQRLLDPNNHRTVYTQSGAAVSEAVVR
jgi:1,4-alpha-glucan branching enzyme